MDRILGAIILVLIAIVIIIVSTQLYYKFSYLSIFLLLLSFFFEIVTGYFFSIKQLEKSSDVSLLNDTHLDISNIDHSKFSNLLTTLRLLDKKFSPNEIQTLKINYDNEGSNILNFKYAIQIDNLTLPTTLWRVFTFFCLPTLLSEILFFLPTFLLFKIPILSGYFKILWDILSFLLLLQISSWVHEFAHIIVSHLVKGVEYVVKTPFKYRFIEICLAGGILTKFEFRFETFWKKLSCAISGLFANLILALLFLILYFYTTIILFYIGFIINIVIFYIHSLPITVVDVPFDGKIFVQELALFKMSKKYKPEIGK